jgi:hypothetical protein
MMISREQGEGGEKWRRCALSEEGVCSGGALGLGLGGEGTAAVAGRRQREREGRRQRTS